MHACTIIARNYPAHARVLAKSFRSNHPTGRFSTLILDDLEHEIGDNEPFEVIRPSEIMDIREFIGWRCATPLSNCRQQSSRGFFRPFSAGARRTHIPRSRHPVLRTHR